MAKNLVSGQILAPLAQIWTPNIFFANFTSTRSICIVASYHCIQFQVKLMNQTWENGKKPSFEPDFGPYGPNSGHQIFFSKIWLAQSLDILVSYYHVQYQKKPIVQYWENLVTDRQTDGRTNGAEWFHRTLSD